MYLSHTQVFCRILRFFGTWVVGVSTLALTINVANAIDEFKDLKKIASLPSTQREIEAAFRRAAADACEMIPKGESLEVTSFMSMLTQRDRRNRLKGPLLASSRRNLFTVGLEFNASDRMDLPTLSRSTIAGYIDDHYVAIQARTRRDLLDRELYYHHRPIAVTGKYRGARLTEAFEPLVANSIRDFHSLGLFVPEDVRILKPKHFRLMVLLFRTELLRDNARRPEDVYEFAFVLGREVGDEKEELEPHVFVTSNDRTKLEYLRPTVRPFSPRQCSVLGRIAVTDYDSTGLYPKESVTRDYRLDTRTQYEISQLDAFCEAEELRGGYGDNLLTVLNAVVDGKLDTQ